jgi:PH domain
MIQYWRRRLFKLEGSRLTAYHESTGQIRATINLAKATKLIDDKKSLTQTEVPAKGKGRRKSAFAEEEEGYMFVEEGFRIRFANGETIDFYADSANDKEAWMMVLGEMVGKDSEKAVWTQMVLDKEKKEAAAPVAKPQQHHQGMRPQSQVVSPQHKKPLPSDKSPRHQRGYSQTQGLPTTKRSEQPRPRSLMF